MALNPNVAIIKTDQTKYPEFLNAGGHKANYVYDMLKEAFRLQGYDAANYGKDNWNPLGKFISPGNTVLLKPNLVMDINRNAGAGEECLYTQPSVVAAVLEFVLVALDGHGHIIVGDAPMQSCDFDNLIQTSDYKKLIEYYMHVVPNGVTFEFKDFRGIKAHNKDGLTYFSSAETENCIINLGADSEFYGLPEAICRRMRITDYDPHILLEHHNSKKHEYCVNRDVLLADVIINMPKPKTHRKAGVTIALKNLVGINSRKEYLPHHTNGSVKEGGDEYLDPSILKRLSDKFDDKENYYSQTKKNMRLAAVNNFLKRSFAFLSRKIDKDSYTEGSWSGNDTISKTICDLNKIIFYADKSGVMCKEKQRKYFIVADMIVSGEKEGPVYPSPKNVGILAVGEDPVSFDKTIAALMGADVTKIPTLLRVSNSKGRFVIDENLEGNICSNDARWNGKNWRELKSVDLLKYTPSKGWKEIFAE